MRIHKEGYRYIILATILWAIIGFVSFSYMPYMPLVFYPLHLLCFAIWFWVIWFFRLPSRNMIAGEHRVISPADGKVVVIEETEETEFYKDRRIQVSVFMSPLNVHVNRNPVSGVVSYLKYHPGKYLVAWHPKSSTENERTTIVIENNKVSLLMRQIAGAMARRICFYIKEGDAVEQNQEYGFIRFGSRVDLFLPLGTEINVKIGDVVKGGVSQIATIA